MPWRGLPLRTFYPASRTPFQRTERPLSSAILRRVTRLASGLHLEAGELFRVENTTQNGRCGAGTGAVESTRPCTDNQFEILRR